MAAQKGEEEGEEEICVPSLDAGVTCSCAVEAAQRRDVT